LPPDRVDNRPLWVPVDSLKAGPDPLPGGPGRPEHGDVPDRPLDDAALIRRATERFGYGCRPGELETWQRAGWTAWQDTRLQAPAGPDPGAVATPVPTLPPVPRVPRDAAPEERRRRNADRRTAEQAATLWWLDRMVRAEDQLTERLTWFWHGHFATSVQKVRQPGLMVAQNESLRAAACGRFPDLARAMIVDPAMLIWLDGNDNRAGAPNENLSREFLELFTLGRGNYTESDVQQAARALSGWRVDRTTGVATLVPARRDGGATTILGRTAVFDATSFVDHVLAAPATPPFVLGRLWFRLVSSTPPDPATLATLVRAWGAAGDIRAAVVAMAGHPAFRDGTSTLVKQPVEWAVGLLRTLGVTAGALPPPRQRRLLAGLAGMGQLPFRPPSVGGWPAGGAWLTTSAALSRTVAARAVVDVAALPAELTATPVRLRVEATRRLLGVDAWSDRTTRAIGAVADSWPAALVVAACSPEYVVSA
jgi:uncharacterized protein (DUF1800 family)